MMDVFTDMLSRHLANIELYNIVIYWLAVANILQRQCR